MTFTPRTAGALTLCLLSASLALAQDDSLSLRDEPALSTNQPAPPASRGLRGALLGEPAGSAVRPEAEGPRARLKGRLISVSKKALRELIHADIHLARPTLDLIRQLIVHGVQR